MRLLKVIGICAFAWILWNIDRAKLMEELAAVDPAMFLISLAAILPIYLAQTLRWHMLVRCAGLQPRFRDSWRLYNIGMFLGTITPGRLGDLGRAGYLKQAGMNGWLAVALVIIDRLADLGSLLVIAAAGTVILWGNTLLAMWLFAGGTGCVVLWLLWKRLPGIVVLLPVLRVFIRWKFIAALIGFTMVSWCLYFVWTGLVARSVGVAIGPIELVAVMSVAWLVAILPIAPSGLGTRDAALIALLAPYGIAPEQAVSLAFLMFVSILLSSIPGGIYWLRGIGKPPMPSSRLRFDSEVTVTVSSSS